MIDTVDQVYNPDGGYWPRPSLIPRPDAVRLRPTVVSIVQKSNPATPNEALSAVKPVYRMAYWADQVGYSTEPTKLMIPDRVEEFHNSGLGTMTADSRRAWRSILRTLGRANTPQAWGAKPTRDRRDSTTPPYSETHVAGYFRCVPQQATAGRSEILWRQLNIGLGCGLTPDDYLHVYRQHVTVTADGLTLVTVPNGADRPRVIPVLARYAPAIQQIAADCPPDRPLVGDLNLRAKNPVVALLAHVEIPSRLPHLTISRLRRTYLVCLANADVRLSEIMLFGGLAWGTAVIALLPYVETRLNDDVAFWKAAQALL